MVLMEAFQQGTPVIARRLGSYPEIIEESGAGLLFDSREELVSHLRLLAGSDTVRERLGSAGRRVIDEKWSEEKVIGRYLEMIEGVERRRVDRPKHG